jgi:thiamine biosynthesis lipoprotein
MERRIDEWEQGKGDRTAWAAAPRRGQASKAWALVLAVVALGAPGITSSSPAGAAELERFEYRRVGFGGEARLVLYAEHETQALAAARAAYARLGELDRALSDYREDGALADLRRSAGGAPCAVPSDLLRCLVPALEVAQASAGAFDPTIAPLSHLWRAARAAGELPAESAIAAARELVDHRELELDLEAGTARLARTGQALDLGGVAKGFAADELRAVLAEHGLGSVLVDLGGDLSLGAPPPGRGAWTVAAGSGDPRRATHFELRDCAIATSGPGEQHLDASGRRFSHLLDPRSGYGLQHARTVTVVAPTGAIADALASAASVLPVPAAEALVSRFPGARLWIEHGDAVPLFDGESLAGWTTVGGRYDGEARWSVEDGAITGRTGPDGAGGLLYTERFYSAFELEFEVRLDYPYDSGLFTLMLPPDSGLKGLQVTLDHRPGGEIGAIYADGFLEHRPEGEQFFRRGEWNRVRVRQTGFDPRVEVWIGDRLLTDYTLPPGTAGFARHGRIGLQVHGADSEAASRKVQFKNLWLRELPVFGEGQFEPAPTAAPGVARPTAAAAEAGWSDLLAEGLAGFAPRGDDAGYGCEGGVLTVPAAGHGELATVRDYTDFELTLEFELAPKANSGLYLRAARDAENPSYQGAEVQLIDDLGWEAAYGAALLPYQRTGGLYAVQAPPAEKLLHPPGKWNRLEVLCRGPRLAVALNGLVLYDLDTTQVAAEPPFAERPASGFLGLQRYGATAVEGPTALRVRNWFVRTLP